MLKEEQRQKANTFREGEWSTFHSPSQPDSLHFGSSPTHTVYQVTLNTVVYVSILGVYRITSTRAWHDLWKTILQCHFYC